VEVNEGLEGSEDAINRDPYGDGWLFKVEVSDPGAIETLMDVAAYQAFVAERAH
jgi:glycine cleavage system H protein